MADAPSPTEPGQEAAADPHAAALDEVVARLRAVSVPGRSGFDEDRDRVLEGAAALSFNLKRAGGAELPEIVVIFGPSGGGKSTLFNALMGRTVSRVSSVERPATRGAVLAAPEARLERLLEDDVFPTLPRRRRPDAEATGQEGSVTMAASDDLAHLVLIDSPDYDTHLDANRAVAERVLDWADRVIFVASTERYADRAAARYLTRMRELDTPVLLVLNKVEGDADELIADFLRHVETMGGPRPRGRVAIPRRPPETLAGLGEIDEVRRFLSSPQAVPLGRRRSRVLDDVERLVLAPIRDHHLRQDELAGQLLTAMSDESSFNPRPALGPLRRYEEESRFWLRYSHRGLLKGMGSLLRDPKALFRTRDVPAEPQRDEIAAMVVEQAWSGFEMSQIVARETLKRSELGRELLRREAHQPAEMSRSDLEQILEPLVERLTTFTQERLDRFRREWAGGRRGLLARARFWALDKILKLLTLALTLTVLPPLIYELLRFIGHPSFTSEVEQEFKTSQALFRELLDRAVREQLDRYRQSIQTFGPPRGLPAEVEGLLMPLRERAEGGAP